MLVKQMQEKGEKLKEAGRQVGEDMKQAFVKTGSEMKDAAAATGENVKDAAMTAKKAVQEAAADSKEEIRDAASLTKREWQQAVRHMGNEVKQGFSGDQEHKDARRNALSENRTKQCSQQAPGDAGRYRKNGMRKIRESKTV